MVRAYLMARTLNRTSNELVDAFRRTYDPYFIAGSTVYGWYDAFIEVDLPNRATFTTILQELLHDQPNVTHLEAAVERPGNHPLTCYSQRHDALACW
jgi:hypothetical protein